MEFVVHSVPRQKKNLYRSIHFKITILSKRKFRSFRFYDSNSLWISQLFHACYKSSHYYNSNRRMHTTVTHGMENVKILPYSCIPIISPINIWLWVRVMNSFLEFLSFSVKQFRARHVPKHLIPMSIRSLCKLWVLAQKPNPVITDNQV
jgi:hypothetical protein